MYIKKIIILSAIITGLAGVAGCTSSSSSSPSGVSATVTTAQLVGTWLLACEVEAPGSYSVSLTLTTTDGTMDITEYSDTNCQLLSQPFTETFSYTLGADFTLDGTVAGITTGTELKKMGYQPGPLFATILNHLLEAKLDGRVHTRKDEKKFVKEHYPLKEG